mgnify:CR=1 FL=1
MSEASKIHKVVIFFMENHTTDNAAGEVAGVDGDLSLPPAPDVVVPDPPHDHAHWLTRDGPSPGGARRQRYSRATLPNLYKLMDAFTVCDRYFSDFAGNSFPNHAFARRQRPMDRPQPVRDPRHTPQQASVARRPGGPARLRATITSVRWPTTSRPSRIHEVLASSRRIPVASPIDAPRPVAARCSVAAVRVRVLVGGAALGARARACRRAPRSDPAGGRDDRGDRRRARRHCRLGHDCGDHRRRLLRRLPAAREPRHPAARLRTHGATLAARGARLGPDRRPDRRCPRGARCDSRRGCDPGHARRLAPTPRSACSARARYGPSRALSLLSIPHMG